MGAWVLRGEMNLVSLLPTTSAGHDKKNNAEANDDVWWSAITKTDEEILLILHKKWSFPLRISSVNVTKSTVSCGFGHVYWRNS